MAATPPASPQEIQPAFKRVQQSDDFDCAFACIATITGKSLDDVRTTAIEQFKLRAHGPVWVTEDLIAKLFAHYGFVSTVYKEVGKVAEIPDVAITMVDYDPETEIGRHVVFVRDKRNSKQLEYLIDVSYWSDAAQHVRTDINNLPPAWYIGVHPMSKPVAKTGK